MSHSASDNSMGTLPDDAPHSFQVAGSDVSSTNRIWIAIARVVAAIGIAHGVLIYCWGRTLLEGVMINGRPKALYAGMLFGGIAVCFLLTNRLSHRFRNWRYESWLFPTHLIVWTASVTTAACFFFGRLFPQTIVIPFFTAGSIWVPMLAWLRYKPQADLQRIMGVIVGILFQVGFIVLFRVDGIQGEFQVDFNWRIAPKFDPGATLPVALGKSTVENVGPDLNQTSSDDFPQFLGPHRSGFVENVRLSPDWDAHPPREIWRIEVGAGWSGFAVVGEYAVTQEQRGTAECVVCYSLADGKTVWIHSDEARFESSMGGVGPRATPTINHGKVYTVGGSGLLNCLDGKTGRPVWTVDILLDNGGKSIGHGVCGSPLIVDDLVIVSPTGVGNASLVAYDKQTGQRRWQGGKSEASYGSPMFAEIGGRRQILLVEHDGLESCDLATGKLLWNFDWSGDLHVNCSQPVLVNVKLGRLFYGTGYNKGCVLLNVKAGADGALSVADVWKSPGKMKTKFTTAVKHGEYIYGLDDGILACVDLRDGKQLWKGGRYAHGQILLVDDLLIVQAEAGDVHLVRPDSRKLTELGKIAALSSKTWNNPALAGSKLLVRNDREAICIELAVEKSDTKRVTRNNGF